MSQLLKFVPLEPVVHNKRSRCSEKLAHCHWRTAPTYHNYRKPRHSDKDPEQPKIKFKKTFKNRGPWFWNLEKESFLIKLNKNSVGGKNDLHWCKAVDCLFFITPGFISLRCWTKNNLYTVRCSAEGTMEQPHFTTIRKIWIMKFIWPKGR